MILNIILLYDKVGCLLDILGQEKCFQCLQKEKSAQSLNRASAQRSLLGREKSNIQRFLSTLPGWTCSVSVSQRCLYHLCARSEDIQFLGWGATSITRSFAGPVLFFLAENWTSKRQRYGIRWCQIRSPEGCPINLTEVKIFWLNAKLLLLSGVVSCIGGMCILVKIGEEAAAVVVVALVVGGWGAPVQDAVDAKCTDLDIAARVNENFYLQYLKSHYICFHQKSQVNDFFSVFEPNCTWRAFVLNFNLLLWLWNARSLLIGIPSHILHGHFKLVMSTIKVTYV